MSLTNEKMIEIREENSSIDMISTNKNLIIKYKNFMIGKTLYSSGSPEEFAVFSFCICQKRMDE